MAASSAWPSSARLRSVRSMPWERMPVTAPSSVTERLINEIDVPLLERAVGLAAEHEPHVRPDERLAGLEHAVEDLEVPLALDLRNGLPDRLADQVPVADQLVVPAVRPLEDMAGPLQDGRVRRGKLEHLGQLPALGLHLFKQPPLPGLRPVSLADVPKDQNDAGHVSPPRRGSARRCRRSATLCRPWR